MANAEFEVGESEKHLIDVNANPFLKYVRIDVDGNRVIDVVNLTPSRKFQLEVGNREKHDVEIHIKIFHPIKLFVDGKETKQM
jgi:hypothetical protein